MKKYFILIIIMLFLVTSCDAREPDWIIEIGDKEFTDLIAEKIDYTIGKDIEDTTGNSIRVSGYLLSEVLQRLKIKKYETIVVCMIDGNKLNYDSEDLELNILIFPQISNTFDENNSGTKVVMGQDGNTMLWLLGVEKIEVN